MSTGFGHYANLEHQERQQRKAEEEAQRQAAREAVAKQIDDEKSPWAKDLEGTGRTVRDAMAQGATPKEQEALALKAIDDIERRANEERAVLSSDDAMRRLAEDASKQGNSEAQQWVQADKQAQTHERHVKIAEREYAKRSDPDYLTSSHKAMTDAHDAWVNYMGEGKPPVWQPAKREEYMEKERELRAAHTDKMAEYNERIMLSSPEQMKKLEVYIAHEKEKLGQAVEQRQGIAHTPSEAKEQVQNINLKQYLNDLASQWKPNDMAKEHAVNEMSLKRVQEHRQERAQRMG